MARKQQSSDLRGALQGVAGNAIWTGMLVIAATLGAVAKWFHGLNDFESGVLYTLISGLLSGVLVLVILRVRRKSIESQPKPPAPPEVEIPDSVVVPALLERLPADQKSLLIALELGEKTLPEDEPGLADLERNRLAQRLRLVHGRHYLFRMHPENTAAIHAWVAREVIGQAAPRFRSSAVAVAPSPSAHPETLEQLRSLRAPTMSAAEYAYEYLQVGIIQSAINGPDEGKQIIAGLLSRYFLDLLRRVNTSLNEAMQKAGAVATQDELRELLARFGSVHYQCGHAVRWCRIVGEHFYGGATLYKSEQYRGLVKRHRELTQKLQDVRHRLDIGAMAEESYIQLKDLLVEPSAPAEEP